MERIKIAELTLSLLKLFYKFGGYLNEGSMYDLSEIAEKLVKLIDKNEKQKTKKD
jgi:hypothetical protein